MSEETKAPETPEVPKDLLDKIGAVRALIEIHELINESKFEGFKAPRIIRASEFISNLHSQLLEECKKHPSANLVPGLFEKKEEK